MRTVFVAVLEDSVHGIEVLAATADRGFVAKTAAGLLARSDIVSGPIEEARRSVLRDIVARRALQPAS